MKIRSFLCYQNELNSFIKNIYINFEEARMAVSTQAFITLRSITLVTTLSGNFY